MESTTIPSLLQLRDYHWDGFPLPRSKESAFNRYSGDDVCYIIEQTLHHFQLDPVKSVPKLELLLRNYLPDHIKQRDQVLSWIKNNRKHF